MVRRWRCSAGICALSAAQSLTAQSLDTKSRTFVEAATVVIGYDVFATRCTEQAAFTPSETEKAAAWHRENAVDLLRGQIRALERDTSANQALAQARASFALQFAAMKGRAACISAIAITQLPDAQIATKSPQLLLALRGNTAAPTAAPATLPTAPATRTTPAAAPAPIGGTRQSGAADDELVRRIESFGFDTRAEMGMGGFIGLKIYPVVLFRDGTALRDVAGLGFTGGLDAHRRANADNWTQWRKQGSEIQLQGDGKWKKLAFPRTYSTLPPDFHLSGRFRRSTGAGNIAMGGTSSVTVINQYLFSPDGRVVRDGAFGSTSSAGDMSVVTSGAPPDRRGRYTITGLTLHIRYDDGSEERRILVTDPADPKSAIWLDGNSYVRR